MKKYLMGGIAAIAICAAFTSCSKSNELFDQNAAEQQKQEAINKNIEAAKANYAAAFEKAFGKVGSNVDWGFGSTSKAGTRAQDKDYPATSHHINANGNEWAASTTGDNPKEFGGWLVPAPLTEGQIARVKAYFQSNPNLTYVDPHWRHFFIQQVYKGGDDPKEGGSPENIISAGNKTTDSNSMTELFVGPDKNESYKINNFAQGDAKSYPNVLNNGQDVNSGDHYSDKILLMVNVDNTSTFTYFNTTTSSAVNNKCALVAASVIDEWAERQSPVPGSPVVDQWERSFLGFDLALMEGNQVYAKDWQTGEAQIASYQNCAESPNYAWDGEKVIDISGDKTIRKSNGDAIGYIFEHKDWYVAADQINMSQTSQGYTPETANTCTTPVIKEFTYNGTKYQSVVNLRYLQYLADNDWVPTNQYGLTNWVKVGKSDGYFSDWIVTLTRGDRIDEKTPETPTYRVIAEDLNASEASDFDFNDVVFDVEPNEAGTAAKIVVRAAGGIYKLTVAGQEVHAAFGENAKADGLYPMINTQPWNPDVKATLIESYSGDFSSDAAIRNTIKNIVIKVYKPGFEENGIELEAQTGKPACKILVDQTFNVVTERTGIADKNTNFHKYVQGTWDTETNGFWWKENK